MLVARLPDHVASLRLQLNGDVAQPCTAQINLQLLCVHRRRAGLTSAVTHRHVNGQRAFHQRHGVVALKHLVRARGSPAVLVTRLPDHLAVRRYRRFRLQLNGDVAQPCVAQIHRQIGSNIASVARIARVAVNSTGDIICLRPLNKAQVVGTLEYLIRTGFVSTVLVARLPDQGGR